jgi:beta-1,4-mannosyl-glycoprotein beta-1,4-N-acetylglucosaminyltransferase
MKIIDCFIFYNELDLLNYRLNILNSVVDYFIIVESTHTFIGKEKYMYFNDIKHLFDDFKEKIIHIIVDDFPYKYPDINIHNRDQWKNETFQRNAISRGFKFIENLSDDDIITITDLDEIPDPKILLNIKNNLISITINTLELDFYYYNLNTKFISKWDKTKILSYKKYNELQKTPDDIRSMNFDVINNGGWHLSYFGDSKFIQNKLQNFSHQEFNNSNFTDLSIIEDKINNCKDLFNNNPPINITIDNNTYLPPEYNIYLTKYY